MGFILLDPPMDSWNSPEGLERWIAELDDMVKEYSHDPEIVAQITEEREREQRVLEGMRAYDAAEGDGE